MKEICRGFHFTSYYASFQTNRVHSKWARLYNDLFVLMYIHFKNMKHINYLFTPGSAPLVWSGCTQPRDGGGLFFISINNNIYIYNVSINKSMPQAL